MGGKRKEGGRRRGRRREGEEGAEVMREISL